MKRIIFKISLFSIGFITTTACSQKTEKQANEVQISKTSNDSSAIINEKKIAQEKEKAGLPKPYNPKENAEEKIAELVKKAQAENKNIMMQAGGNWCIWCLRFNNFIETTPEIKEVVDRNYLYYHLNYSPDNKNEKVFEKYGNPGKKFGYPHFIVLDKNGKELHIQESGILEEGSGYSKEKVLEFFNTWKPKN